MPLDPSAYEKLGAFYLGRPYDPASGTSTDTPLLYDSRDLTTHAVCVGMTGSGKTGLCLALLEEAAMDNVPAIIIDPKGDLGNLLLTFPDLRPEDFRPWINEDDALRKGMEPDAFAAKQAETWKNGLAAWGQSADRIRALREKVEMTIYTPGSTAGVPVNVLASFAAPKTQDAETLAERAQTSAAGLLGLIGRDADPVKSRDAILLSAILLNAWQQGTDLDLSRVIEHIQNPPFEKVGVLNLETFYPAKDRFELVMAINNIVASPGFATWQQGDPLDAERFLHTTSGKPRFSIFSLAHLGDAERMFFVTLLLNETLGWMRSQSGTTSLRAILYMDEIYGYLPPSANPPSKTPFLTLLKQARAFGLGIVVATQNPVDLDYKALSNCGTWFLGRLQTERDKARVLDGLEGAGGTFNRAAMEATLSGLTNRIFVMNNVHEDGPVVFETRWVMSYLRGPLTREQIRMLTSPAKQETSSLPSPASAPSTSRPSLPPDIRQLFAPAAALAFRPVLLCAASLRFKDAKLSVDDVRDIVLTAPFQPSPWEDAEILEVNWKLIRPECPGGATFQDPPSEATVPKNYARWEKDFVAWLGDSQTLHALFCPALKLSMKSGESEAQFRARAALAARESRDGQVDALRNKFAPKFAALQARYSRAQAAVQREREQASQAKMQTYISVGSGVLGALFGRKVLSSSTVGRATTAARGVGRSMKESADVGLAEESVSQIQKRIDELQTDLEAETASLTASLAEPVIESIEIKPVKSAIQVRFVALGWVPA